MTALPNRHIISVEEYFQLEENNPETKYEYFNGVVTMLAGGTLDHATISANVYSILRGLLRGGSCRAYNSDARVKLNETFYVYPDVTVTCDENDRGHVKNISYPRLVVEVLSPSTQDKDRGEKFTHYRDCPTIQEYMIVNTDQRLVEVYRREKKNFWSYIMFQPGDEIELIRLGVHFPVTDVYEDINFPEDK